MRLQSAVRFALALLLGAQLPPAVSAAQAQAGGTGSLTDLDAFMARVLERRDENWKKLHDYVLSETERFSITGPGKATLYGFQREYSWYVRDGYLIRSPIRFDGVTISEPERRRYEDRWLSEERSREDKQKKEKADQPPGSPAEPGAALAPGADTHAVEAIVTGRVEPRFVSEAYFLKFKFEPGNYYLVGRELLGGREVLRVEYYPTRLFREDEHAADEAKQEAKPEKKPDKKADKKANEERQMEERINQGLNKISLVTLWIEPKEYQIVRYTFDNVDFGFLPGRWLVRFDSIQASMTMGKVLDGVWLPSDLSMRAGLSLASGSYQFTYGRQFHDHKKAEVSARIRSIGGEVR